jgi:outer membrane protein assembly factor BamB/lysophospholipase L1-like esterase
VNHRNRTTMLLLVGVIIGTLPLVGAPSSAQSTSGSWPQFRHNPAHTGHNPAETLLSRQTAPSLTTKWTYTAGGEVRTSPAVVDGAVFAATTGRDSSGNPYGRVFRVEAATGNQRWSSLVEDFVLSSPAVAADRVFIGTGILPGTGSIRALDANSGSPVWTKPIPGSVGFSSPNVVSSTIYIGSTIDSPSGNRTGRLYALDAGSGSEHWVYEGKPISGSPAVANGLVYVGAGEDIVAVEASSGTERWRVSTPLPINSSPAVVGNTVFVAANNDFYALDAVSGGLRWRSPVGNVDFSSPAIAAGMAYVGGRDGGIWAFDATTGEFRWRFSTGANIESSPAVGNGVVTIGGGNGTVYAVNADSGKLLWFSTPSPAGEYIDSSPAIVDGVIYIGSSNGALYSFGPPTPNPTTTSTTASTTTTSTPTTQPPPTTALTFKYVGLGDSYSAGEGVEPFFAPLNRCHRSLRAYATKVEQPGRPGASIFGRVARGEDLVWGFQACSGAVTASMLTEGHHGDPLPQLALDRRGDVNNLHDVPVDANTDLATLTIGGNDIHFARILEFCYYAANCASERFHRFCEKHTESCRTAGFRPNETLTQYLNRSFRELTRRLDAVYRQIRNQAPNARVLVLGYPQLFPATIQEQRCFQLDTPNPADPINSFTPREQNYIRLGTEVLNRLIQARVQAAKYEFVRTDRFFAGHEVCGKEGEWINGPSYTVGTEGLGRPDDESFHPNACGQDAMAVLINLRLNAYLRDVGC